MLRHGEPYGINMIDHDKPWLKPDLRQDKTRQNIYNTSLHSPPSHISRCTRFETMAFSLRTAFPHVSNWLPIGRQETSTSHPCADAIVQVWPAKDAIVKANAYFKRQRPWEKTSHLFNGNAKTLALTQHPKKTRLFRDVSNVVSKWFWDVLSPEQNAAACRNFSSAARAPCAFCAMRSRPLATWRASDGRHVQTKNNSGKNLQKNKNLNKTNLGKKEQQWHFLYIRVKEKHVIVIVATPILRWRFPKFPDLISGAHNGLRWTQPGWAFRWNAGNCQGAHWSMRRPISCKLSCRSPEVWRRKQWVRPRNVWPK